MDSKARKIPVQAIILTVVFIIGVPMLTLIITGQWDWWEAWVYVVISVLGFAISRVLAARRNPDLIKERADFMKHENTQTWDKRLAPLSGLGGVLIPILAGLDMRFHWTGPLNMLAKLIALLVTLAGYLLASYALIENRFFSGTVRIQQERGHHVISSGPYRWVRHPGYAGAILTYLGTPVFLDSWWTMLPALFVTIVLIIRTSKEDAFLLESLEGYDDFARRTRYRLLPGVW